ncbi:ribosomal protein L11 methyltransferase [Desulfocucumis palustris]|uniref:Ribosomal protein L11 methyltransferase n=1 Tax=Desulfocucumis palustris TaxID=1898651 RepID=A0A2L2XA69_9FIRM|nr:50S ribosomal protein L11 methyltransferase [Desulfocucumis palustris]GBF33167.1 ribosomal protein L11 methyltransferase [Desulfocucumis palustris]
MKWLEIAVSTTPEGVETVAEILNELGTGGVVIEDPAVLYNLALEKGPEEVAVEPGELLPGFPSVKGYFPLQAEVGEKIEKLRNALAGLNLKRPPEITTREVQETDWANQWKKYYHTTEVGQRFVIKPSWEEFTAAPGKLLLEMDPGMAFGCGTHPSTVLCLLLLEELVRGGEMVYDVGTGSGILAVAAAKLGAARVLAVDTDGVAVKVARENIELNGVDRVVKVVQGNLLDSVKEPADIIIANIVADVIMELAPAAVSLLKPGGIFISSGIYLGREKEVQSALAALGFAVLDRRREGDWTALTARKM